MGDICNDKFRCILKFGKFWLIFKFLISFIIFVVILLSWLYLVDLDVVLKVMRNVGFIFLGLDNVNVFIYCIIDIY